MTCEDARECFPLFREGRIRLTELAAVEAHISQCATCRGELDRLQGEKSPARASRGPSADASSPAALTDGPRRPRLLVLTVLASAAALVILIAIAFHVYQQRQEHRIALEEATAARDRYQPREPATPESPVSPSSPAQPKAVPPVAQTPRPGAAGRSADIGPMRAVPLPSPPPPADRGARQKSTRSESSPGAASRGQRDAAPPAAPASSLDVVVQLSVKDRSVAERGLSTLLARVGATQVRRQRDFTFVAVVPQSRYGEFTRGMAQIGSWQMETDQSTVSDPVHVAVRLVSPGAASRGQRDAAPPAASAPSIDVVVQLSVTDRSAAERDLSTLLARVGATQVRRQRDFTFVAVVPQSRYGEFTRGMAQIGSWQMETHRSTVPDPVHVAVRLVSPGSRRSGPGT